MDGGAGRCPREGSRSGEALQRSPRLCRAAPSDGGPGGRAPPRADVALPGRDAPLPARCSRARPAAPPPRLPVTPDAVEQLHEGEGEVEAEEGEEVARGLVRQDRPAHGAHRGSPAARTAPGGRSRSPGGPGASAPSSRAPPGRLGRGAGSARPGRPWATHLNQPDTFLSRLSLGGLYSSSLMERGSIFPAAGPRRAGPAGRAGGAGALPGRPTRRFRPPPRLRRRAPGLRGRAGGRAGAAPPANETQHALNVNSPPSRASRPLASRLRCRLLPVQLLWQRSARGGGGGAARSACDSQSRRSAPPAQDPGLQPGACREEAQGRTAGSGHGGAAVALPRSRTAAPESPERLVRG